MKTSLCGGVYEILNLATGKMYIGATSRFSQRWSGHRMQLQKNAHHSYKLQNAWNKYGENEFIFRVLEVVPDGEQAARIISEQKWIDRKKPQYNVSLFAGGSRAGLKSTEQHRANLRAALQRPATQKALSARWKGKTQSDEHRAARAVGMRGNTNGKGKKISDEERERLIAARKAQAAADKAAGIFRGHRPTPEQRAATAERMRKVHAARKAAKEQTGEG